MDNNKPDLRKHRHLLLIGLIAVCIGNMMGYIESETFAFNFLKGVFHGLSVPLILFGLYAHMKNKESYLPKE